MQTVLASTGHLPEWLASARTTRQSSTGDIPHMPPRRMSRMGSNTNSNAAAALVATAPAAAARAQHQHQHLQQHPQQQHLPSLHIEQASEGSAVASPQSASSPKQPASDRTSEATAVTESSGVTDKDAGHVWLLERHLSKGGFGSLTFSQFVCAEEGLADEEKEVMSQLQQQLQLAEVSMSLQGTILTGIVVANKLQLSKHQARKYAVASEGSTFAQVACMQACQ